MLLSVQQYLWITSCLELTRIFRWNVKFRLVLDLWPKGLCLCVQFSCFSDQSKILVIHHRCTVQCSSLVQILHTYPCPVPFSIHTPDQPLQSPHVHRSPSFHVQPKKTKTYTESYKTRRCLLHCSGLVLILNFYPFSYPYPSQATPKVNPFHSPLMSIAPNPFAFCLR